jgi:hypothetical protein
MPNGVYFKAVARRLWPIVYRNGLRSGSRHSAGHERFGGVRDLWHLLHGPCAGARASTFLPRFPWVVVRTGARTGASAGAFLPRFPWVVVRAGARTSTHTHTHTFGRTGAARAHRHVCLEQRLYDCRPHSIHALQPHCVGVFVLSANHANNAPVHTPGRSVLWDIHQLLRGPHQLPARESKYP